MSTTEAMKRPRGKPGRPPRERAGEVEERILDAARQVFIDRGFEGASVDEIAAVARAGKPTIYGRFAGKEALFAAVVARPIANNTRLENYTPVGQTFEERLVSLGVAILERVLDDNTVDLIRFGIAEARRFPDLASSVNEMARKRASEAIAQLLGEIAKHERDGDKRAFAADLIPTTARIFQDLIVMSMLIRALMGEDIRVLRTEISSHVSRGVCFFLAACMHGGIR